LRQEELNQKLQRVLILKMCQHDEPEGAVIYSSRRQKDRSNYSFITKESYLVINRGYD